MYKVKTSIEQTCNYTIIFSSQVKGLFEAHRHTDTLKKTKTLTHWHIDTQTHRHTDTQPHTHPQIALQSNNKLLLIHGKSKFWEEEKPYTKTLFPPDFVLAMVVSERDLEKKNSRAFRI